MESLKDQLAKFFPALQRPAKAAVVAPKTPVAVKAAESRAEKKVIDWKVGVTPITSNGKIPLNRSRRQLSTDDADEVIGRNSRPLRPQSIDSSSGAHVKTEITLKTNAGKPVKGQLEKVQAGTVQPAQSKKKSTTHFGSASVVPLTRANEFKRPDSWVWAGHSLNTDMLSKGKTTQVRIGVDFGTAYTKVALHVAGQVLFVPWHGMRQHDSVYYLPGEISVLPDDSVYVGRSPDAKLIYNNLKLPFLERNISTREQFCATVAYLAWVMKYVRGWLYSSQAGLLRGRNIAWEVNLGCPSNSWGAKDLKFSYETLGLLAWQLSQEERDIRWRDVESLVNGGRPRYESIGLDSQIHLIPEFIAQIVGYVKSPQRRDGLHLLMDIGAGTLDLATFNVVHDKIKEADRYPIFASKVLPMGTHFLMSSRLEKAGGAKGIFDDLQPVPTAQDFATRAKAKLADVQVADKEFQELVTRSVYGVLDYTRALRYPMAPEWTLGLPAFISGGGAGCDIYVSSLIAAFQRKGVPLRRTPFPLLDDAAKLDGIGVGNFHRLSVAYGLTFDSESVGHILAPNEIADAPIINSGKIPTQNRPDRDELYPK